MSLPTNSTAPTGPEQSSSATLGHGLGAAYGFRGWFVLIINWIRALSPAGATTYDTGWETLAVSAGWKVTNPVQVRRVGRAVFMRGIVQAATANPTEILASGIVPVMSRPSSQNPVFPVANNAAAAGRVTIGTNGSAIYAGALAVDQYVYLNAVAYLLG